MCVCVYLSSIMCYKCVYVYLLCVISVCMCIYYVL